MAYAWQTVEEAAVTMGISTRTLHRRIAKGELETRLENGRREVLVTTADPEPAPLIELPSSLSISADAPATTVSTELADSMPGSAPALSDTALAVYEDRMRRMDLALSAFQKAAQSAADDVRRARQVGYIGWSTVGVLVAGIIIALTWAVHRDSWAQADIKHLTQEVKRVSDESATSAKAVDRLRGDAEQARIAAAKAEGELTALKAAAVTNAPSTRPSLLTRLAGALGGQE